MYHRECYENVEKKRWSTTAAAVIVATLAIGALTVTPAQADDFTWDGQIDQYWDTSDNWSPDGMARPAPGRREHRYVSR